MWIETQAHDLINLNMISSINLDLHNDKYLIWANGDDSLLACYSSSGAAFLAYHGIIEAIKDNLSFYKMPNFAQKKES